MRLILNVPILIKILSMIIYHVFVVEIWEYGILPDFDNTTTASYLLLSISYMYNVYIYIFGYLICYSIFIHKHSPLYRVHSHLHFILLITLSHYISTHGIPWLMTIISHVTSCTPYYSSRYHITSQLIFHFTYYHINTITTSIHQLMTVEIIPPKDSDTLYFSMFRQL